MVLPCMVPLGMVPLHAQSADLATVTQDGVTLHITRAGFLPYSQISPRLMQLSELAKFGARQHFAVWYRFTSKRFTSLQLRHLIVKSRLQTPDGDILDSDGGAEGVLSWSNVDPGWKNCSVEFSFDLPQTAESDLGLFKVPLLFDDVPLPSRLDQTIAVNRAMTTPGGTTVTLLKTTRDRVDWPMGSETYLTAHFSFETSAPVADATFSFEQVVDESGINLVQNSSGGNRSGHDFSLRTGDIAGKTPSRADMTIGVKEVVPDFKQNKTLRFPFLTLAIPGAVSQIDNASHLLTSSTRNVEARLEPWHFDGAVDSVYSWLWLQDRSTATDGRRWYLVKARASDDKGRTEEVWPWGSNSPFSLSNGEIASSNARCDKFGVRVQNLNRATRLNLAATVEPRITARHIWDLTVPIPATNADMVLNNVVTSVDGAEISLKVVRNFSDISQLPGSTISRNGSMDRGLAVVVQWFPTLGEKSNTRLECVGAFDIDGEKWDKTFFGSQMIGDATQLSSDWDTRGKTQTFFLTKPPRVSSLQLRLSATESRTVGARETLQFNNIVVPKYSVF